MIERFKSYRVEEVATGRQFDATCLYQNIEGGMMLAEKNGSKVVRVFAKSGDPHPNCSWGAHRVLNEASQ